MKRIFIFSLFTLLLIATVGEAAPRRVKNVPKTVTNSEVIDAFKQQLEKDSYLSEQALKRANDEVLFHIEQLKPLTDRESYVTQNELREFLTEQRENLLSRQEGMQSFITSFLKKYDGIIIEDSAACRESLTRIINDKLGTLETNLNLLDREMNTTPDAGDTPMNWGLIGGIAGGVVVLIIIIAALTRKKETPYTPPINNPRPNNPGGNNQGTGNNTGDPGIVIRRKTATILKKQSLEDVIDNPHYLKVDLEDCCYESAVRRMYIKDRCIADIFKMYAKDPQNPSEAREYGCMVLGRWVHDKENNEYYVSLEDIVLPGDDAVFEEYALNFGGKIKLRVHEALRHLRQQTNLQYDLTCWVHSHPGLSVFFSNSDSTVQDQLKHPQHPNFLTALVVDTLTPKMDIGVFTYHRDQTLNSKNDLKKLYSLKEWNQWAQESLKVNASDNTPQPVTAPKPKETTTEAPVAPQPTPKANVAPSTTPGYNTLATATEHTTAVYGIELTRDTALDLMMSLAGAAQGGISGTLHCSTRKEGPVTVYVCEKISNAKQEDGLQPAGAFVVATHMSLPSVRKAVGDSIDKLKFALVYTTSDATLTSIPTMSGDLCADEAYYGVQQLDQLKQWTKQAK